MAAGKACEDIVRDGKHTQGLVLGGEVSEECDLLDGGGSSYLWTMVTTCEVRSARQRGRTTPAVRYLDAGLDNGLGMTVKQLKASAVASVDELGNLLGSELSATDRERR
jgi:hypothetical protein